MNKIRTVSLIAIILFQFYHNYTLDKKIDVYETRIDVLEWKADSLHDEVYIKQNELLRYDLTIDMIEAENKTMLSEFYKYYSQTE